MSAVERSLRRSLLRDCRRLGPDWLPRPPPSGVLWGRGFQVDPQATHPLLLRSSPQYLHKALALRSRQPLNSWIRSEFRKATRSKGSSELADRESLTEVSDFLRRQHGIASCSSSSEVAGLRLDAVTGLVQKNDASRQRVFAYNMRFTNVGQQRIRVLSRQYDFQEEGGDMSSQISPDQPEAAGIVGYTPLIEPGEAFEFGSGCALKSARGTMAGRFLVMVEPEFGGADAKFHSQMEEAELMMRLVYYKGIGTEQFALPIEQLQFDEIVKCV